MSSLDNLSELEERILARMRAQNLDPYRVAPERHVSTDDSSSDESDGRPPWPPPAARLENADWANHLTTFFRLKKLPPENRLPLSICY
ncbi:hypothetical protein MTO96_034316 [Rhipicephalus appendiculatus]